jgi:hypothetical protein
MNRIVEFNPHEILPGAEAVFKGQGIPAAGEIQPKICALLEKANDLFLQSAKPIGMLSDVSKPDFEKIFIGEGRNAEASPLESIIRRAENLALFACTLGGAVSDRIAVLFERSDFALGSMLDSVASAAADRAAKEIETLFLAELEKTQRAGDETRVLGYSPGYCGWDISGQKQLFRYLRPESIGITLTESFLMVPLKSVTGVLVAGPLEIHRIERSYPFCRICKTQACETRMTG